MSYKTDVLPIILAMVDHGYCSDLNVKFEKLKMLADVSF